MRYVIADVFTDTAYGGNQLAVFPEADGLDTRQMQAIAREMNLAETTFVTPGTGADRFAVRIFTPLSEVPFAGHPTIGTAVVLSWLGRTPKLDNIVLEEKVGPVRVALRQGGATLFMQGPPEIRPLSVAPVAVADALGLKRTQLSGDPWCAGYGFPFLFVPVRDQAAVSQAALAIERWNQFTQGVWGARSAYVHAATRHDGETTFVYARMFAPSHGIPEDPATGSAAAALAGSLDTDATHLVIDQGVDMGRPSRIEARITRTSDAVTEVSVGGGAVVVAEGRLLRLP